MNKNDSDTWKNFVLGHVLEAFASHEPLRNVLIFKGARILNLLLGEASRQSLDIDSNMDVSFASHYSGRERLTYLKDESYNALHAYFQAQRPIRFQVDRVRVEQKPPHRQHPFGWTGICIVLSITDRMRAGTRGLPRIEVDVASPEKIGEAAVIELPFNGCSVRAYSLARIAGEKLRAFLSSLPAYIHKIGRRHDHRRVKDIYDIARIAMCRPISDSSFWETVAAEFVLACESRFIDCHGLDTFGEGLSATRIDYENATTIPTDIPFDEAWAVIEEVVAFMDARGILPLQFPLPQGDD